MRGLNLSVRVECRNRFFRPADPRSPWLSVLFLQSLNNMSVADRTDIVTRLAAQDERGNGYEDPEFNRGKNVIITTINLTVNVTDGPDILALLIELQTFAKGLPSCLRYEVCQTTQPSSNDRIELLVNQSWSTSKGWTEFQTSNETLRIMAKIKDVVGEGFIERRFATI